MKVEKTTSVRVRTTDGAEIKENDTLVFLAGGKSYIGQFKGFGKRGSIEFLNPFDNSLFAMMPNSIDKIFRAEIKIEDNLPMNKPEESEE